MIASISFSINKGKSSEGSNIYSQFNSIHSGVQIFTINNQTYSIQKEPHHQYLHFSSYVFHICLPSHLGFLKSFAGKFTANSTINTASNQSKCPLSYHFTDLVIFMYIPCSCQNQNKQCNKMLYATLWGKKYCCFFFPHHNTYMCAHQTKTNFPSMSSTQSFVHSLMLYVSLHSLYPR